MEQCEYCGEGDNEQDVYEYCNGSYTNSFMLHPKCVDKFADREADYRNERV